MQQLLGGSTSSAVGQNNADDGGIYVLEHSEARATPGALGIMEAILHGFGSNGRNRGHDLRSIEVWIHANMPWAWAPR